VPRAEQKSRNDAEYLPDPLPNEASDGARAGVGSPHGYDLEARGGKELSHACRSRPDFMREIAVARGIREWTLRQPEVATRLESRSARVEKLEQSIGLEVLDTSLQ